MCNSRLTERWQRHKNVLKTALERQSEQVKLSTYPISIKNKTILGDLVDSLRDFSMIHMQFFADGFTVGWLESDDEHPEEFILGVTSRQIAHDLSVIERAIDQRRDGVEKRKNLEQADVITNGALARAQPFLSGRVWPITYLNKSPVIRVIPYAPVALIGIPYTVMDAVDGEGNRQSDNFDYLAIAHEVGHFVYWHGRDFVSNTHFYNRLYEALKEQFPPSHPELKPSYAHWLEEIFADVFAAMVGGTATALSIQVVVSDNLPKRMTEDDGEHPLAILRPYIYTQVLQQMGLGEAAGNLEQLWKNSPAYSRALEASSANPLLCLYSIDSEQVGKDRSKSLEDIKADLQTIAVLISNALQINSTSAEQVWTKEANPDHIFATFDDKVGDVFQGSRFNDIPWPHYEINGGQEIGEWHFDGQVIPLNILTNLLNAQGVIRNLAAENPPIETPFSSDDPGIPTWKPIYQVGGWSSGGGDDAYPY